MWPLGLELNSAYSFQASACVNDYFVYTGGRWSPLHLAICSVMLTHHTPHRTRHFSESIGYRTLESQYFTVLSPGTMPSSLTVSCSVRCGYGYRLNALYAHGFKLLNYARVGRENETASCRLVDLSAYSSARDVCQVWFAVDVGRLSAALQLLSPHERIMRRPLPGIPFETLLHRGGSLILERNAFAKKPLGRGAWAEACRDAGTTPRRAG